jgi:branched-chain amino acid transport system permease protein
MRRISLIDIAGGIVVVAGLALAPMFAASNYLTGVLTVCAIYGIWASSWDFMSGLTGRENFGHSLFIGAGAYTAGFLATIWFANPWYSLPAAVVIAVAFSLIVGFPTLRLRGPYFALAMLSASAILQRLCLIFWEYTGGEEGLYGLEPLMKNPLQYYWFVLAILVVTVIVLTLLAQSHWGLLLRAIRGDEATCQAAGINVTFYKIASLAISAAFADSAAHSTRITSFRSVLRCSRWWCRSLSSSCAMSAASDRSTARPSPLSCSRCSRRCCAALASTGCGSTR